MAGKFGCTGTAHGGGPCNARPIRGTDRCKRCCGTTVERQRAKGRLVLTAREYGFTDEIAAHVDTADYMLALARGSFSQAKMYERLLAEAYDAAERLRDAPHGTLGDDDLPAHTETATDRERALYDLQRVFRDGGVSVLIGAKYAAAGKDGDLYQAEEGIRALVDLWNGERDRAFRFAKDCRAAGLEERLVELEEAKAELVFDVLRNALMDLDGLLRAGELSSLAMSDPAVQRVLAERLAPLALGGAA